MWEKNTAKGQHKGVSDNRKSSFDMELYAKYRTYERTMSFTLIVTTIFSVVLFLLAFALRHATQKILFSILKDDLEDVKTQLMAMGKPVTAVPLWLQNSGHDHVELGRWARLFSDIALTIVLLMWTTSICGWLCVHEKNKIFFNAFIMCNIVNIGTEIVASGVFLAHFESLSHGLREDLTSLLAAHYDVFGMQATQRIANSFMVVGNCCGINGPNDFIGKSTGVEGTDVLLSPACCKLEYWGAEDKTKCMTKGILNNTMIHHEGCFDAWKKRQLVSTREIIYVSTAVVCGLQMLQLILSCIILRFTTGIIRLDMEQIRGGSRSSGSQNWVSGLRATTVSELMMSNEHIRKVQIPSTAIPPQHTIMSHILAGGNRNKSSRRRSTDLL